MSGYNRDEIERRLDQAIDALNAEQTPVVFDEDHPELIDLIDTARLVRQLRDPADADDDFPANLSAALMDELLPEVVDVEQPSKNGRISMVRQRRTRPLLWAAALVVRALGVAVVAGMAVGLVVGGIGGRIAMRMSGYLYEREHPGTPTITESSGQLVGNITLSGTLQLMAEMALFTGISAGFVYLLFRPWLPGRGWRKGLVVGAFFLLALGSVQISSGNVDFRRLGSPLVNVLMYGSLVFIFGLLLAPLSEWIHRRVPEPFSERHSEPVTRIGYFAVMTVGVLVLLAVLLTVVSGTGVIAMSGSGLFVLPFFLALIAILALVRLLATSSGVDVAMEIGGRAATAGRWFGNRRVGIVMSLLVGALFLFGAFETLRNIYEILDGS